MTKNKITVIVFMFVLLTGTFFLLSNSLEIKSMRQFLNGFTLGITGTGAVFSIIYMIWEYKNSGKEKNTKRKTSFSLAVGLTGLFSGLLIFKLSFDEIWIMILGSVLVGLGTVFNVNYLKLKQKYKIKTGC